MKKWFFVFMFGLLLIPFKVRAANFTTSMSGVTNITSSAQFTVTFSANSTTNLKGILGNFSYDSSKLTILSSSPLNNFALTLGSKMVLDSTDGKSGNFSFASITFRANSSFAVGESSTISLTNVTGTDGTNNLTGGNSSHTVTVRSNNNNLASLKVNGNSVPSFSASKTSYTVTVENQTTTAVISATLADGRSSISGIGTKNLKVYNNTFSVTVTAENGSKKTYTLTIIRKDSSGLTAPLSDDNNLSSLTIEGYTLDFINTKLEYELTVENNVNILVIKGTAASDKATVEIDKSEALIVGDNLINITVTAQNGSKKIYKLVVKRKSEGPTVSLGQFLSIVDTTSSDVINIDINDDDNILTKEILSALKTKKKRVFISQYSHEKIIYKWEIDGANVNDNTVFNTSIIINNIDKKLDELTNYTNNLYLDFAYSGTLPKDTYVSVYVADKFQDGEKIKLYYYDKTKKEITKISEDLEVKNGFVRFKLEHCSDYILSMADYNLNSINIYLIYQIIIAVLLIVIICLIVKNILLRKKIRKPKKIPQEIL